MRNYHQVLVFEEILSNRKTTFTQTSHKTSNKKTIHIIELNSRQIYIANDLHKIRHYTMMVHNVPDFISICNIKDDTDVQYYESDNSHVGSFVSVINYGTAEWTSNIEAIFSKIKFNTFEPVLRLQQTNMSRNNIQLSGGFSSQSYTSYDRSKHISKPRLLKLTQTKSIIVIKDIMTSLCYILQRKKLIIGYGIALAKHTLWKI